MEIERFDGMPPFQPDAGNVLYHVTVHAPTPYGVVFQAKPDATDEELKRVASAEWGKIAALKGIKGGQF